MPAETAQSVFDLLKLAGDWGYLSGLPVRVLERKIQIARLAKKRSRQIKQALLRIARDFGSCRLSTLRDGKEKLAHQYLTGLPGVSDKVAKCVMMYTLGFNVLPVEVHVFRVSSRLGWTKRECFIDPYARSGAKTPADRRRCILRLRDRACCIAPIHRRE
jgi:endonuclease-3